MAFDYHLEISENKELTNIEEPDNAVMTILSRVDGVKCNVL